jgi:hypothetical protein
MLSKPNVIDIYDVMSGVLAMQLLYSVVSVCLSRYGVQRLCCAVMWTSSGVRHSFASRWLTPYSSIQILSPEWNKCVPL